MIEKRGVTMIELAGVSFSYAGDASTSGAGRVDTGAGGIQNLDLRLEDNECVVVTGCSGSGKTTLTRLLNGLAPGFYPGTLTGEIRVDGKPVKDLPQWERARATGSVFQDPRSQFFSRELAGEIAFAAENFGLPKDEVRARTDALIEEMGLENHRRVPTDLLSSGEKQKAAIASVRVYAPKTYVFDEPSANLDRDATARLATNMAELKARGATLVIAEHRLYYLMELADRFLYMKDGALVKSYTRREFSLLTDEERRKMGLRSPFDTPCPPLPAPAFAGEGTSRDADKGERVGETAGEFAREGTKASTNSTTASVALDEVSYETHGTTILKHVSFVAFPGQIVAVMGQNGRGKTTLARILCGLCRETTGTVRLSGQEIRAPRRWRRVWYSANDTNTQFVTESVMTELLLSAPKTPGIEGLALRTLEVLCLHDDKDRHPLTLSGGQRQRLSLACGLLSGRDILILDEPTSGLDQQNMLLVSEALRYAASQGKTVLVITHDHELVAACCTHIYRVEGEGLQESGCSHHLEPPRRFAPPLPRGPHGIPIPWGWVRRRGIGTRNSKQ
jgi:energy-coupling factor transport system ATP-binding protein